ncbi:bacterial proteasome [Streptomyces sp. HCCB10043]|uniref:Bacterial proteasome n=1 Tax=Streptomyces filamentosus NRRL 15998 TaxID=457431 RepID=D6AMV3_STRFL|nr:bacterial proteasome [Streptomyces filamentosus NRRL 15998]ESU49057.1 bacterial proteasome [Streptomyces sp. HCCB10043]EWS90593.1 proteasome subunit beta [Streptomyces filamentosus NRRL 11379]
MTAHAVTPPADRGPADGPPDRRGYPPPNMWITPAGRVGSVAQVASTAIRPSASWGMILTLLRRAIAYLEGNAWKPTLVAPGVYQLPS